MQTRQREVLDKIIRKASGVVGRTQDNLDTLYDRRVTNKLNDITHPLRQELDNRLTVHSGRMRVPKARTVRYSNSFVPQTVSVFNHSARGGDDPVMYLLL